MKTECTKPNCNCLEIAEENEGGPVKKYACLADNSGLKDEKSPQYRNVYDIPMFIRALDSVIANKANNTNIIQLTREDAQNLKIQIKDYASQKAPVGEQIPNSDMTERVVLYVENVDHTHIVLTNRRGDTFTSKSEELADFLHGINTPVGELPPTDSEICLNFYQQRVYY